MNKLHMLDVLEALTPDELEIRYKTPSQSVSIQDDEAVLRAMSTSESYQALLSHLILLALPTPSHQVH
ncbi:hypothetical protein [Candidatus Berkiella aquae]|uniref:Uncharacterized protein n=1 Tax=Candidatus Berkiella aquae TaxID=295108 RepID=A0A0Q9YVA8_9GAMM|nr:hypothetical protein [Candidatus Berkiella aquae]MCS5711578.1 hypothetical protein [Candidatus Berkiella aquae]